MFKCKNCQEVFERPVPARYYDGHYDEFITVCPVCGSDNYTDVQKCLRCGEWYDGYSGGDFCPNCEETITDVLTELFAGLDEHGRALMETEVKTWLNEHW